MLLLLVRKDLKLACGEELFHRIKDHMDLLNCYHLHDRIFNSPADEAKSFLDFAMFVTRSPAQLTNDGAARLLQPNRNGRLSWNEV